jgi:hypothetical protein
VACSEALVAENTCKERQCAVLRQAHLIAVVGVLLIGCAVLLVGCSGAGSEASQEEQGRTEATRHEQGYTEATETEARSPQAASEEDRCEGTRTIEKLKGVGAIADSSVQPGDPETIYITNDIPGCPNKGGVLSGTDKADNLDGKNGEDEIHGLGGVDDIFGGDGSDVIYGAPGNDELRGGRWNPSIELTDRSKDVLYGGPGRDVLDGDAGDDVLYGGDGDDFTPGPGPPGFPGGLYGGRGTDVIHGGDGNDFLVGLFDGHGQRDKLYCGEGRDAYLADKTDYVDSSCEEKFKPGTRIP